MEVITIIITIIIKEELRWGVAEKVKHPDPSLPEALLVLVRSGSGQECGFDYLLPTTYDLRPTTYYLRPTTYDLRPTT